MKYLNVKEKNNKNIYRNLKNPSMPPHPGASAARHCQGPMIQGQLPRENTRCVSGWCNVMLASAVTDSPCIHSPPSPRPE